MVLHKYTTINQPAAPVSIVSHRWQRTAWVCVCKQRLQFVWIRYALINTVHGWLQTVRCTIDARSTYTSRHGNDEQASSAYRAQSKFQHNEHLHKLHILYKNTSCANTPLLQKNTSSSEAHLFFKKTPLLQKHTISSSRCHHLAFRGIFPFPFKEELSAGTSTIARLAGNIMP